jgi:hypothetical protein
MVKTGSEKQRGNCKKSQNALQTSSGPLILIILSHKVPKWLKVDVRQYSHSYRTTSLDLEMCLSRTSFFSTQHIKDRKLAENGATSVEIFGFHIHKNECGFLKLDSECSNCTVSFRVLCLEHRRLIPESRLILDMLDCIHTDNITLASMSYSAIIFQNQCRK